MLRATQRRALFRHLNFQKCSEREVFLTFFNFFTCKCASRHNGVHFFDIATSVAPQRRALFRSFSTSQLPKVLRTCGVLYILTWKCASRHNGVQFFISHLACWLRTRRFSEPTFRPSGASNHWKNIVFRDFPTFSPTWIFFLLTLSLSSSLLFSDSSHLCFSSVHIVGSLISKLPSINNIYIYIDKYYT